MGLALSGWLSRIGFFLSPSPAEAAIAAAALETNRMREVTAKNTAETDEAIGQMIHAAFLRRTAGA